jgi:predicted dehydrogenase
MSKDILLPLLLSALQNGKPVMCEKPLGGNPEESRVMCETAGLRGKTLKTGFNHRHHAAMWMAKELHERGETGGLISLRCRHGHC